MRLSRCGPNSLTVARTGWPDLPYKSQNTTGLASCAKPSIPICATRSWIVLLGVPGIARPATSPFTSAMNTGTPRREKPSASTSSEMVLPVPVAPATSPWRLPYFASSDTCRSPLPIRIWPTRDPPLRLAGSCRAREPRDAFDVRSVGEEVERYHFVECIAARGEVLEVACQRPRAARDVDHSSRLQLRDTRHDPRVEPGARWVHHPHLGLRRPRP